jgi:hypothetical protein
VLWPFKTTVKFEGVEGEAPRLYYAVSAANDAEAMSEIERRLHEQEIRGYSVESVTAASALEAEFLNLPPRCVQLVGVHGHNS